MAREPIKAAKGTSLEYLRRAQSVLREWGEMVASGDGGREVQYSQSRHAQIDMALMQILAQALEAHHRANGLEERIVNLEATKARKGKAK